MDRHSRREFLRLSCGSTAGALLAGSPGRFGPGARARDSADYKALVCIFLFGGNDANNLVIPIDSRYSAYQQARPNLALAKGQLLPLEIGSRANYGLHPSLPELQGLFNRQKNLAILANVGTLVRPTTRESYRQSLNLPEGLYSHSVQQDQWQSARLKGPATTGWAGMLADRLPVGHNRDARLPAILSLYGNNLFSRGAASQPLILDDDSTPSFPETDRSACFRGRSGATGQVPPFDHVFSQLGSAIRPARSAFQDRRILSKALSRSAPLQTVFPRTGLGEQLKRVAQVIAARKALGIGRQLFFCCHGGFDTHSNQIAQQEILLTELSQGMHAFYRAGVELGVSAQVTSFTLSEFGRSLKAASTSGTGHGWGSHQLILGGAVKGNAIYGTFPSLVLGGEDDAGSNGSWIPTTALDQYGAALATWFGVSAAQLPAIFPNLRNFPTSRLELLG